MAQNRHTTPSCEGWDAACAPLPREAGAHCLFQEQARRVPERIALAAGEERLTYAQLDERSDRLARVLRAMGVGPQRDPGVSAASDGQGARGASLVGIYMDRSADMVVAILAVWKAGGAYVPLDPYFPSERLAYMIEDSGLGVLLTNESLRGNLPQTVSRVVVVDGASVAPVDCGPDCEGEDADEEEAGAAANGLAYVMYTSGSTGKPKGVQVLHRGVANFLTSMRREPGLDENDVLLAVTTLSFDISVLELFLPLTTGAQTVVVDRATASSGSLLARAIEESGATVMQATPVTWQLLLAAGWEGRKNLKILCGGEAMSRDLARELLVRSGEVWNMYGPTETTVWSTCARILDADAPISIGRPIANTSVYILDAEKRPVPFGAEGELYIGGEGVALGYLNRPDLTQERFVPNPFAPGGEDGARMYATGDLARCLEDGSLLLLGRSDHQVKIRGHRIEVGEIETALLEHPSVAQSVVVAREDEPGDKRLVAYVVPRNGIRPSPQDLRRHLLARLPDYMTPAAFVALEAMPQTPNGKIDRRALPVPDSRRPELEEAWIAPESRMERELADLWKSVLKLDRIGARDNFFDLGGNSLLAFQVAAELSRRQGAEIPVVRLFEYPTIRALALFLTNGEETDPLLSRIEDRVQRERRRLPDSAAATRGAAVIGMAGRFPGAKDLAELWKNLCAGAESVSVFAREELGPGIEESLRKNPDYVPARGIIADADKFDAAFFGIRPREAEIMDPQQRVFLEVCWAALENAGYDPERFEGLVGVYAGMGNNTYFRVNVSTRPDLMRAVGDFHVEIGNEKDHIAPRVSYLMNLKGPSLSVHTACSTSLVTVDNAFHDLMAGRCDIALAGGVDITVPQKSGQLYQDGGVFTRDGHCRPFDAEATGTMFGEGVGVVVLKRLDEAVRDGDAIYAVIAGSAINHDGSNKVSYLAPSVEGQAEVVALAQARAGFDPASITFIEAHGTGTPVGDPIEVEALTKAFRLRTDKKQFCAIGSIKGNLSHSTTAAGIAGLLKVVLCLHHKTLVPSINYSSPNPRIDFANSPFYVNTELKPWPAGPTPRRAGVSSFGFCGTNAHAVLEEAPEQAPARPSRPRQLVLLSAKTQAALDRATRDLKEQFETRPETSLPDAAYTLQTGRKEFEHRRFAVCRDAAHAAKVLGSLDANFAATRRCEGAGGRVAFMFPGQGAQYVNMGANLYRDEPVFREAVDRCAEILKPLLGRDLREVLYPAPGDDATAAASLKETFYTQPAIFTIEYALAQLWASWGIRPAATIGHSIGEFVCACLAGVFSLENALLLVATRGRLMQSLPGGAMLSVRLPAAEVEKRLGPDCSIAAVNGPSLCVVAGPGESVEAIRKVIENEGATCRRLHTSHAFHSPMMDPIVEPFAQTVKTVPLAAPKIPFVSTVTTRWITPAEATDPMYWARHLRSTVRFAEGVQELWKDPSWILLEVGPRSTAATLAIQQAADRKTQIAIASLCDTADDEAEWTAILKAVGRLWLSGVSIDWKTFYSREERRRIALPTYAFERTRYWIDPALEAARSAPPALLDRSDRSDQSDRSTLSAPSTPPERRSGLAGRIREVLERASGLDLSQVEETTTFVEMGLDSLFLTQAARQLQSEFGVKVSFRQMLTQYPTLLRMAEYVEEQMPEAGPSEPSAPAAQADLAPQTAPATEPQQELWVSSQMGPEASCALNESVSIRLCGPFDAGAMQSAIRELPKRHEALRASFSGDGATLSIAPEIEVPVETLDLSEAPENEREERLAEAIRLNSERPFDLATGPLVRARIVRMNAETHVVILAAHHIVCDGWSLDVLLKDLGDFYSAFARGTSPDLGKAGRFSAYALAQREALDAPAARAAEKFWLGQLPDPVPPLDLPSDFPRPPVRTYDAARVQWRIDPSVAADVRQAATRLGCSLFTTLLAAWQAFLHRISGQDDLVVGIPSAGQPLVGQDDLVGHCANFLPLRSRFDPERPFRDYVGSVSSTLLDAYEHQVFSYGRLLKTIRVARDPGRIPLVSTSFTHSQEYAEGRLRFAGLRHEYSLNPRRYETFELQMNAREAGGSLEFLCHCNTNLFRAETVERWLREYEVLLASVAADPDASLGTLRLLTEDEKNAIETWNATQEDYPRDVCVHQLFEAQAERTPDRMALSFENESLAYADLNRRADRLASRLRRAGAQRGGLVAFYVERSMDMVVGLLAILKSGAAYLPLDPMFPRGRLEFMIQDAGATVVLTEKALAGDLPECPGATVVMLDEPGGWDGPDEPLEEVGACASDRAYVLYTSGSTGKPKGVEISHRALVNFLLSMQETPGLTQDDVVLGVTTLSFDIAALELFLPLIVGARCAIVGREALIDHALLMKALEASGANVMQATPALWRLSIDSGWKGKPNLRALCGGEALSRDLADKLLDRVGELWNLYGPTETTVWSAVCRVERGAETPRIGLPVANTQIHVLDSRGQVQPLGVPGEIHIGGDGLALGYLNRPELTAERFVPDPFSKRPGDRFYRTGDLARRLADGSLEFLGRLDHQVKVRGYRIELGEIETLLREHPAVRECAVAARQEASGDTRLVGYFATDASAAPTASELRAFLLRSLPDYMAPAAFVCLESFPLTPNGKLDRRALPAPDASRPDLQAEYVAPRTELERAIADVWQEALSLERVGVYDNFFDLGGHSLLLVQVFSRLKPVLDGEVSVVTMFQFPTIDALTRRLAEGAGERPAARGIRERAARQREAIIRLEQAAKGKQHAGESEA